MWPTGKNVVVAPAKGVYVAVGTISLSRWEEGVGIGVDSRGQWLRSEKYSRQVAKQSWRARIELGVHVRLPTYNWKESLKEFCRPLQDNILKDREREVVNYLLLSVLIFANTYFWQVLWVILMSHNPFNPTETILK